MKLRGLEGARGRNNCSSKMSICSWLFLRIWLHFSSFVPPIFEIFDPRENLKIDPGKAGIISRIHIVKLDYFKNKKKKLFIKRPRLAIRSPGIAIKWQRMADPIWSQGICLKMSSSTWHDFEVHRLDIHAQGSSITDKMQFLPFLTPVL